MALIFARRSARIRTCSVSGNPSALVLPSVKHFLLQTLSSDRIRHRCVLLTLLPISIYAGCPMRSQISRAELLSLLSPGLQLPAGLSPRSLPLDLYLLTRNAPRTFRAIEPGYE